MRTKAVLVTATAAAVIVLVAIAYRTAGRKEKPVSALDPAKIIVIRTPGGMLEVATLKRVEEFAWQAKYECPLIDCSAVLKPTISKVRVPVHYVYRVPLADTWELRLKGDQYELTVPGIQPSTPVAFDSAKLEVESTRGWFSPTVRSNEKALMRQLGSELDKRAGQDSYLRNVQPEAARTVQEFAQKWMRQQGRSEKTPVTVQFRYAP